MGKIIGVTGRAGSGKDTAANYLKENYPEEFRSIAFADPIRGALKTIFGWEDSVFAWPTKEQMIDELGKSPRQIMQTLGTEWGRDKVHTDIWLMQAMRRAKPMLQDGYNVLVTDVRFENEARFIRENRGIMLHVHRGTAGTASAHVSEAGVKFETSDLWIDNNSTMENLHGQLDLLAQDLFEGVYA